MLKTVGVLALLLAVGIPGCSWYNDYRFNQLLAQWQAMGEPDDIDSWLASQPCDLELAREWQEWLRSPEVQALFGSNGWVEGSLGEIHDSWFPNRLRFADRLAGSDHDQVIAGIDILLAEELDISASAFYHLQRQHDPNISLDAYNALDNTVVEDFSCYRNLCRYLSWCHLLTAEAIWLDRLDALVAALAAPDTLFDQLVLTAAIEARDRSHLLAARRGDLTNEQLDRWVGSWNPTTSRLPAIVRRSSCCLDIPIALEMQANPPPGMASLRFALWWAEVKELFAGQQTKFLYASPQGTLADAIERQELLDAFFDGRIPIVAMDSRLLDSQFGTSWRQDHLSRAIRLAALALCLMHDTEALPQTLDHPLATRLLAPRLPGQAPMRYRRNNAHSFTILVDSPTSSADVFTFSEDHLTFDLQPKTRPAQDDRRSGRGRLER